MNYQESLELLQQVCNDLLNSQHHRSIAFAAKPKIEEALVSFNKCIEEAIKFSHTNDLYGECVYENQDLKNTISKLEKEIAQLKSVHLAAEHGKAFEVLEVEEVEQDNGGWIENNGHCPFEPDVTDVRVDLMFAHDYGVYEEENPHDYDWDIDGSEGDIKYWRHSNA